MTSKISNLTNLYKQVQQHGGGNDVNQNFNNHYIQVDHFQNLSLQYFQQQQQHKFDTNSTTNINNNSNNNNNVRILACSAGSNNFDKTFLDFLSTDRKLCEDRKHHFDHLKPANLAKSTIRLSVTQAMFFFKDYMNDQLKYDLKVEKRVDQGEITRAEADLEIEAWEQREWMKRWSSFPSKLFSAIVQFQSIVLLMRLYEHIASKLCSLEVLDKLTQDTFKTAQRLVALEGGKETMTTEKRMDVGKKMFLVCQNAGIIAYLADYSFHQVMLCYGYYVFLKHRRSIIMQQQRQQEQKKQEEKATSDVDNNDDNENVKKKESTKAKEEMMDGTIAFSLFKRSTLLAVSRGIGLLWSSAGGALGTIVWPGWGTMAGTNLGDSLAGVCIEELNIGSLEAPKTKTT